MTFRSALGLSATIERLSVARHLPKPVVAAALAPYARTGYLSKHGLDARRLTRTLSLEVDPLSDATQQPPHIEVVIPCGPGDVEVLPRVIESAPNGSTNPLRVIHVVAPTDTIGALKRTVGAETNLIDENDLLGASLVATIGARFPTRRNWVLQQAVKVGAVITSEANGVLILDADTLLLRPRTWLTNDGRQVLTPTIEWHQPYYDFLSRLSGNRWASPEYSFVPHHMLMQPKLMTNFLESLQIEGLQGLVDALGDESQYQTDSMFCIEYELYAQGLRSLSPNSAVLAKWSNRNVPRERGVSMDRRVPYMSVSQHHYLS